MFKLINSQIGRLRILGFVEGISLLVLVFIAVPLKYFFDSPGLTQIVGSIHGGLFLLFVFYTLVVAFSLQWNLNKTTLKILVSSFIPFGTFYVDKQILSKIETD